MVIPVLVLAMMLTQELPAPTVLAARRDIPVRAATSPVDSIRALRSAHRAQEMFELVRRQYLPREFGAGSHRCDVRIGRWCIWNDDSNDREPPPESPRIRQARQKLLVVLDTLGARFPGDEWIASQHVRYLLEAKRHADAVRAADRCTANGSSYLCQALAGLAYHDSGAVAAADSAFSAALSAMPDSVRCRWTDISLLVDDALADRYARADCGARTRIAAAFWNLTTPLYLRDHDWRNEFLARVARAEMEKDSRTPSGSPSEDAYRETAIRYGFDTWFVRDDPPAGSMQEPAIAGYRGGGSGFNFVPDAAVFASPESLRVDDWALRLRSARTNYAPAYARHFRSLDRQQVARFRRGDSALVVATYDVADDTLLARHPLEAGLFAAPIDSLSVGDAHGTIRLDVPARGALTAMAPSTPVIVSLELLDAATRSAARARYALRPLTGAGRIMISDLLLFSPASADSLPRQLENAVALALHGDRVVGRSTVGLFWETYGVRAEGETFAVTITIERIREGWMRRTAERLHLATPFSPMTVRWKEVPDRANGIAAQSVSLDLSRLAAGRYEISLTVSPADGVPVTTKREVAVGR
jgi:hypothetical protein